MMEPDHGFARRRQADKRWPGPAHMRSRRNLAVLLAGGVIDAILFFSHLREPVKDHLLSLPAF
jgi:hypothetical protein